ncbi:hypothetical protein ACLOJK_031187 [Asimina triloba]
MQSFIHGLHLQPLLFPIIFQRKGQRQIPIHIVKSHTQLEANSTSNAISTSLSHKFRFSSVESADEKLKETEKGQKGNHPRRRRLPFLEPSDGGSLVLDDGSPIKDRRLQLHLVAFWASGLGKERRGSEVKLESEAAKVGG